MRHAKSFAVILVLALSLRHDAAAASSRHRSVLQPTLNGPQASADAYDVVRGGTLTTTASTGVLANDSDPQLRALTAVLVSSTSHGTLALAADGSFVYLNDGSASTTDSFTYRANDGTASSTDTLVTITITGATPPSAVADSYSTTGPLAIAAPGVLSNDTLSGGTIASYGASTGTEQIAIGASTATVHGGSVSMTADGAFQYTPANGFFGTDSFRYTVTNSGGSSTADVTITVNAPPPSAVNDSYNAAQGTLLTQAAPGVLANDTVNGATIASFGASTGTEQTSIGSSTATAQGGTVTLNSDGSFTYNPAASFSGSDSFVYVLHNGTANSTGTVTITVAPSQSANEFTVTTPGFFYSFSGISGANPPLTLHRGQTYTFHIDADPIHPFQILDAPSGSVTHNNITSGTITFTVPAAAQNYRYHCSVHDFGNTITTVP